MSAPRPRQSSSSLWEPALQALLRWSWAGSPLAQLAGQQPDSLNLRAPLSAYELTLLGEVRAALAQEQRPERLMRRLAGEADPGPWPGIFERWAAVVSAEFLLSSQVLRLSGAALNWGEPLPEPRRAILRRWTARLSTTALVRRHWSAAPLCAGLPSAADVPAETVLLRHCLQICATRICRRLSPEERQVLRDVTALVPRWTRSSCQDDLSWELHAKAGRPRLGAHDPVVTPNFELLLSWGAGAPKVNLDDLTGSIEQASLGRSWFQARRQVTQAQAEARDPALGVQRPAPGQCTQASCRNQMRAAQFEPRWPTGLSAETTELLRRVLGALNRQSAVQGQDKQLTLVYADVPIWQAPDDAGPAQTEGVWCLIDAADPGPREQWARLSWCGSPHLPHHDHGILGSLGELLLASPLHSSRGLKLGTRSPQPSDETQVLFLCREATRPWARDLGGDWPGGLRALRREQGGGLVALSAQLWGGGPARSLQRRWAARGSGSGIRQRR